MGRSLDRSQIVMYDTKIIIFDKVVQKDRIKVEVDQIIYFPYKRSLRFIIYCPYEFTLRNKIYINLP